MWFQFKSISRPAIAVMGFVFMLGVAACQDDQQQFTPEPDQQADQQGDMQQNWEQQQQDMPSAEDQQQPAPEGGGDETGTGGY